MIEVNATFIVKLEDIDYKATKGETMVMYYKDGSGHPGTSPECEVHAVWVKLKDRKGNDIEVDISEYLDDTDVVEEKILSELTEREEI